MIIGFLVCLSATSALGQSVPMQIGGRITDATGVPPAGPVDLEIKFFDQSSGGKQLGNHVAINGVSLNQGVFQAPIDLSESEKTAIFGSGKPVYMEVTDATNGRTFPRQLFGAVPYAMRIPVDNKTLSFDNSGKLTIGSGSKNPGDVLTVDGSGNLSWGPAAGGIDPAGGTMSGDLDMGGTNTITNVADPVDPQDSATKNYVDTLTLKLGTFDAAGETTLISGLLPADEGKSWYNSTTNEVKYWNGSIAIALGAAGSGLANFNGEVGTTQTLGVPGSSGTAPSWTSNLDEHTLNIPNASAAGVTAGLISKAEYDGFDGKQDAITTGAATEYLKGDLSLGTFATDVAATAAVSANTAASHAPVTIGTGNGLSVSGQALSLATADGATTGALTSTDWTTFNGKAADADVLKKNGSVALTADWNTGGTFKVTNLPTPTANGDAASKNYVDSEITGLGLGTMATQNAGTVSISGGSVTGITDLAIADGGTGASTATGAINALLPSQGTHSGKFLTTDGTNTSWAVSNGDPSYGSGGSSPNDAVFVDNVGRVGIGTTTPQSVVHAQGGVWNGYTLGNSVNSGTGTLKWSSVGTYGPGSFLVLSNETETDQGTGQDGGLIFRVNNGPGNGNTTPAMTILQGGNVGIGTTAPASSLSLVGPKQATQGFALLTIADDTPLATGVGGGLSFRGIYNSSNDDTITGSIWTEKVNAVDGNWDFNMHLGARENGAGNTDRMVTISSTGNVGIGTTAPNAKLEIDQGNLRLTNAADGYVEFDTDGGASNVTLTFPTTGDGNNLILKSDGAGNLSWAPDSTGGAPTFDSIATGSNTSAAMTVGTGGSILTAGTGIVEATKYKGPGSTTDDIDLGTTEVVGTLAASKIDAAIARDTEITYKVEGDLTGALDDNYVEVGGDTMSGPLAMGNNKVTGLATPTVATDAATMGYVDGEITGLSLGTMATQNAGTVSISGGSISGITDLAIADGGTGASTATGAINALLPSQGTHNGKFLTTDGTNTSWADSGGDPSYGSGGSSPNDAVFVDNSGHVGIGTTTPEATSLVELNSTTKGFLKPRMTTAQRNAISSPAEGLEIYNTDNQTIDYFNGTSWVALNGTTRYIKLIMSVDQSVNVGSDLNFDTIDSANGMTSSSNGIDLKAGVTYRIEANIDLMAPQGSGFLGYQLHNGTGYIGQDAYTGITSTTGFVFKSGILEFYTPSVDETLTLRVKDDSIGTGVVRSIYNGHLIATEVIGTPLSGGTDNLGSHLATQNIDLSTFKLVGNGGTSGLSIDATGNVGIGTFSPSAPLDINGAIRIRGGSPGVGKVLTSTDGTGIATWETPGEAVDSSLNFRTIRDKFDVLDIGNLSYRYIDQGVVDSLQTDDGLDLASSTNEYRDGDSYKGLGSHTTTINPGAMAGLGAWDNWTIRQHIDAAQIATSGGRIRITLAAEPGNVMGLTDVFIGHAAGAGDPYDYDGNQVRVTFSGSNSAAVPAGGTLVSDEIEFDLDATKDLIISAHHNGNSHCAMTTGATGYTSYYKLVSEAEVTDVTGYSTITDRIDCFSLVEVRPHGDLSLESANHATGSAPSQAYIVVHQEDIDTIVDNTDLKAWVSRDGGTTFTEATLSHRQSFDGTSDLLDATIDISGQPSGTNLRWKITTHNSKEVLIKGVGITWD